MEVALCPAFLGGFVTFVHQRRGVLPVKSVASRLGPRHSTNDVVRQAIIPASRLAAGSSYSVHWKGYGDPRRILRYGKAMATCMEAVPIQAGVGWVGLGLAWLACLLSCWFVCLVTVVCLFLALLLVCCSLARNLFVCLLSCSLASLLVSWGLM